ncbi:radical SAM protein [Streptomyces sp. GZWMJZ-114]|uniref:radical SAM protein n=1 Tax=Streptomyces sp. GZWMJZ-114 TaxID=2494734 RepID=UPI001013BB0C|nr:radical SAM protein [Streptomyces sp. GZWMJZ-114]
MQSLDSKKTLPVMVLNRQPDAETTDPEINARLIDWFSKVRGFIDGYEPVNDTHLADPDTSLSRTQLLSLAIGFTGCDTSEDRDQRTYTLVYTDPEQRKSNFQTICVPYHAPSSPLRFERDEEGPGCRIVWKPTGEVLTRPRTHAGIFGASNHYYSRVGPDLSELPTAAIVSPYSTCAGGCLGCNRNEVGSFTPPPRDYIAQHVETIAADYDRRGWDRAELISVNITTGCQPNEDRELDMMLRLIAEYRRQGFANAAFFPFTYAIDSRAAMDQLREAGCLGFIGTVECFNDAERLRQWGRAKGSITFEQHVEKYRRAHEAGFAIVETDYVLGADSYEEMMLGIDELSAAEVAVVPNIKRNYSPAQLNSNHEDIWTMHGEYIADGFTGCLATYRHGTIKRRAARASVDYLRRQGQPNLTLRDLPIRHT